jgi:hypothetical protein
MLEQIPDQIFTLIAGGAGMKAIEAFNAWTRRKREERRAAIEDKGLEIDVATKRVALSTAEGKIERDDMEFIVNSLKDRVILLTNDVLSARQDTLAARQESAGVYQENAVLRREHQSCQASLVENEVERGRDRARMSSMERDMQIMGDQLREALQLLRDRKAGEVTTGDIPRWPSHSPVPTQSRTPAAGTMVVDSLSSPPADPADKAR